MADREDDSTRSGLTRRGLLRGLATGVAGAPLAPALLAEPEAAAAGSALPVRIIVNGAARSGRFAPRITLAEALRDAWGLTGTKIGCDRGACGACTVLLDGVPVPACSTLVHDVDGRRVTTVEGLGPPEKLSPIQRAFLTADALQCGFCTSGMLVSCAALLASNPHPTPDQVREAVSGNLCRCGTYPGVFEACERAGGGPRSDREARHG